MIEDIQRPLFGDNEHRRRFEIFLQTDEGKQAAALFIRLSILAARRDVKIGAKAVWERIRWHFMIRKAGQGGERYRLNNNYVAYMARYAMDQVPALRDFFETREIKHFPDMRSA